MRNRCRHRPRRKCLKYFFDINDEEIKASEAQVEGLQGEEDYSSCLQAAESGQDRDSLLNCLEYLK